jgi:hypothetical protein
LSVVAIATPNAPPSCTHWHLSIGGVYPNISGNSPLAARLNRTLDRKATLDEKALLGRGCPRVDVPSAYFRTFVDPHQLSASDVVVSVLMHADSVPPGATFSYDWASVTIDVSTNRLVSLPELFQHPGLGLSTVGNSIRRDIEQRSACVRRFPNARGFQPRESNFRYFALTPAGLLIGLSAGAVGPRVCGWFSAAIPYSVLRKELSPEGARLIAGVRKPRSFSRRR